MVNDRQQVTDDLARLTQQMRNAARELAPTQPAASNKLRSALDGMDENDLGTRMQRSSDWLRSGNFSDPAETGLTSDLQKLGQQVGDAARALGSAQHTSKDAALNRAMDDLSRLRDQLAGLGGRPNGQPNPAGTGSGRQGQPGQQRSSRPTASSRASRSGRAKAASQGKAVKAGQGGQGGQQGGQDGGQGGPGRQPRRRSGRQCRRRRAIATATCMATTTPAILASPVRPWRPSKVPTRPIRSARSTRD